MGLVWGGLWLALRIVLQGALIHKKDRNGDPPLVCAVLANNLEVIRLLVQVIIYYCCRYWFMLNWSASSFRFYTVCVVCNFPGIAFQFGICWICLDFCSRLDLCLDLFLFLIQAGFVWIFAAGWICVWFCFCFCSRLDLFGFLLQVGAHLPFTPSQLGERLTGAARWQLVRFPNPLAPRASESENLTRWQQESFSSFRWWFRNFQGRGHIADRGNAWGGSWCRPEGPQGGNCFPGGKMTKECLFIERRANVRLK